MREGTSSERGRSLANEWSGEGCRGREWRGESLFPIVLSSFSSLFIFYLCLCLCHPSSNSLILPRFSSCFPPLPPTRIPLLLLLLLFQAWLYSLGPMIGAVLGGFLYNQILRDADEKTD